ncbi:TolC family protein, partial [Myxococcota bacterium]|nr:TolC family protein [Myxococcota bacterium]
MRRSSRALTPGTTMNSRRLTTLGVFALATLCAHPGRGEELSPDTSAPRPEESAGEEPRPTSAADSDPEPGAAETVSLAGILSYADAHAPRLVAARQTRARAWAARTSAEVLVPSNPELTVAVGNRRAAAGAAVDVEVSLSQAIEVAGQRGLRLEAAERVGERTEAEIEELRWAVHCDVHAAFHRALLAEERARLAARVVRFQEEVLTIVERQIAAGETAPLTLRLAEAEVAQARQVQLAAEQGFRASKLELAQLAGWPITTPPSPAGAVDAPREPAPLEALARIARAHLPSLRSGAARAREAEALAEVADREAWPNPSLGVQVRREGDVAGPGSQTVVLGVVSVPLPAFDRNQGARAERRAEALVAASAAGLAERALDGELAR